MDVEGTSTLLVEGQTINKKFPSGLRVLLVEHDYISFDILRNKLQIECNYQVTWCARASEALSLVSEKDQFDIVLMYFHMPDMDGLQFLDSIKSSSSTAHHIPVILFSEEYDVEAAAKGIEKGACDVLLKPIRDETLKMIWQHVLRRKLQNQVATAAAISCNNGAAISSEINQNVVESDPHDHSSDNTTTRPKGRSPTAGKAPRIRWTNDLQDKFMTALAHIHFRKYPNQTFDFSKVKASPKEILEELKKMGETHLTRYHISSYLQKFRTNIKEKQVPVMTQSMESNFIRAPAVIAHSTQQQPSQASNGTYNPLPNNYLQHCRPIIQDQLPILNQGSNLMYRPNMMPSTTNLSQFIRVPNQQLPIFRPIQFQNQSYG
ncbi:hypothetical protein SAY87_026818 [Trapa incisa]|uniref:Response regulatory domain-containing protein n=1 Tax=Trapa incisa TaxID=236973 RepID=A0AAN7H1S6_9MYRT|nr:hypothetical protein SAY87_026818 [Trapa incisa]